MFNFVKFSIATCALAIGMMFSSALARAETCTASCTLTYTHVIYKIQTLNTPKAEFDQYCHSLGGTPTVDFSGCNNTSIYSPYNPIWYFCTQTDIMHGTGYASDSDALKARLAAKANCPYSLQQVQCDTRLLSSTIDSVSCY